ncbi:MAG: tetratricopeptide repeat protein [Armatimonadota bacterium]
MVRYARSAVLQAIIPAVCVCATATAARAQIDIAKPFPVRSALDFPAPPYLFSNGRETRGALSGPVNAPRPDLAFFTHPSFAKEGATGRLFYQAFTLVNRLDPALPEEQVWFIAWQPSGRESAGLAQRLFPQTGYDISEVETDGKNLLLRQTPVFGSRKTGMLTTGYRWAGDVIGNGKFVPNGQRTLPPRVLPPQSDFQKHRDQGYYQLRTWQWAAAKAEFGKALTLRPTDAACWYALGLAHEGSGSPNVKRALLAYGKAITLDPARTPAYVKRAHLLTQGGQYAPALSDLTQVIKREPKDYTHYLLRAAIYARNGNFAHAASDARSAAKIEPTESEPHSRMAEYLYRGGNFPQAIASATRALAIDDTANEARLILGYIYARQNQEDKAKQMIRDAQAHGLTRMEHRAGGAEMERVLKTNPDAAGARALRDLLRGPNGL